MINWDNRREVSKKGCSQLLQMKQKGWTVNVVTRLAISSHMTRNKFPQYDGNNRGQRETGKAVSTNSLIISNKE